MIRKLSLVMLLTAVFFSFNSIALAESPIKILELNNKLEYVLIKNEGKAVVDLTGWKLSDHSNGKTKKHVYTFKTVQLKPGEILQVQSGVTKKALKANPQPAKLKTANQYIIWTGQRVWNDTGDIAYLIDDKGNTVAQKENGKVSKKVSQKTAK